MTVPKVSIIIPFVEWNDYVDECIAGCLGQDYPAFDIILLPDKKIKLSGKFKSNKIKVIPTGDVTIAEKRNKGINASKKTDFFAFIDSDAYPIRKWLKPGIEAFNRDKDLWAVGGPNITPPAEPLLKRAVGNASRSFLITGARAFRKKISTDRFCSDLPTCNLIVKKEAFTVLMGFNKKLKTGEDVEFCSRIIRKGKKILYHNKVIVFHHNRSLFRPFLLQRVTYGLSVFRLLKKDPSIYNVMMFVPFFILLFLLGSPVLILLVPRLLLPVLFTAGAY
ncbi:MAG: glycosyltransferase, partial [Spirochaetes bacterium]|nr:glycosyltransferase [Spirochaetota bacterium]